MQIHIEPHARFEREGDDLVTRATISQPTAALGGEIDVPTLDGQVTMTIPAGTQPGRRLRLRGKGMPGDEVRVASAISTSRCRLKRPCT